MRHKTYLITGGAGFVGTHLTNFILDKGHEVIILDNNVMDNSYMSYDGNVSVFTGDIRNEGVVSHVISKSDAVFHLAAQVDVMESIKNPMETYSVNSFGTLVVCDIASKYDVPVVLTSSASVYGDAPVPVNEQTPLNPLSPYGQSKMLAELCLEGYNRLSGMKNTSLRLFNVVGSGKFKGLFHNLITGMLLDEQMTIYGTGEQTRDFIAVEDVCNALWKAVSKPGTFNIGTGISHSVNDVVKILQKQTGYNNSIHHSKERKGEIKGSCADIALAKKELGWKPEIPFKKSMKDLVDWYDENLVRESMELK